MTNETLKGITTLSQHGPGSDGNKEVRHSPELKSVKCSLSYPEQTLWGRGLTFPQVIRSAYFKLTNKANFKNGFDVYKCFDKPLNHK